MGQLPSVAQTVELEQAAPGKLPSGEGLRLKAGEATRRGSTKLLVVTDSAGLTQVAMGQCSPVVQTADLQQAAPGELSSGEGLCSKAGDSLGTLMMEPRVSGQVVAGRWRLRRCLLQGSWLGIWCLGRTVRGF